jgi:hypothetical protein
VPNYNWSNLNPDCAFGWNLGLNFVFKGRNPGLRKSPERKSADALMKHTGRLLRWGVESCRHCKCHKVSTYYAMLRQLTNVRVNSNRGILPRKTDVPAKGIEPSHPCGYWILSPARLPVPPRRRFVSCQEHRHFVCVANRHVDGERAPSPLAAQVKNLCSDQVQRLQTAWWSKNFAQDNGVPQTRCRS